MDEAALRALLESVRTGAISTQQAFERVRALPFEDVGFARLDHHRTLRTGIPEVVYGEGKSADQIASLLQSIHARDVPAFATRVDPEKAARVLSLLPAAVHNPVARTLHLPLAARSDLQRAPICVVSAGTSDAAVAEEAAVTLEVMGSAVVRVTDVGVAGIHRLFDVLHVLRGAHVNIVVAGMEGALPSVVAGLVSRPVIAVPTSIGYGANFGGLAALLGMLCSCAPGVTVVNIDNGFGAACAALLIARSRER